MSIWCSFYPQVWISAFHVTCRRSECSDWSVKIQDLSPAALRMSVYSCGKTQQPSINWFSTTWPVDQIYNTHVNPRWMTSARSVFFSLLKHCRSAATADKMQSQGRLNPITGSLRNGLIPGLEGQYDFHPITAWWGRRWGLGNVNTRPLWLCGIKRGTRLGLWDEDQDSYIINGCLLFFCLFE